MSTLIMQKEIQYQCPHVKLFPGFWGCFILANVLVSLSTFLANLAGISCLISARQRRYRSAVRYKIVFG